MIDPRRLRVLRALADHGTVTAAAKALYLSPSAVSQQLAALEAEVGHALLERHGRAVRLTATGAVLAGHAAQIAIQLERAEADLAAVSAGAAGEVTIAAFSTAITEVVAPLVAGSPPRVRIKVKDAEGRAALRLLLDGEVDVAVAVANRDTLAYGEDVLLRQPLYTEPFDAVLPPDHPLREADGVELEALATAAWITPWPGNPVRDVVLRACENAGFQPRVECVSDDFRAVCALVEVGAGVALVPRSALSGRTRAVVRPVLGDTPTRPVFTAIRRGGQGHPLLKAVLDGLREKARNLTPAPS
ncbi:LysR family transcriptional regulator [Actinomadura macrotermitis]|uniref:HTH-type transcriptional regulator GltC n=1 Tax=Actinomadura macrotermitis TaxID=2585200 RepID=A0A7K0BPK4_9ACTN|nr:LysR family transcriptional regulator [Actinomadura macrotermitis]MQY02634.1 HTH-type transcriptional regulator GltC [Actinomadura macrotermitis]